MAASGRQAAAVAPACSCNIRHIPVCLMQRPAGFLPESSGAGAATTYKSASLLVVVAHDVFVVGVGVLGEVALDEVARLVRAEPEQDVHLEIGKGRGAGRGMLVRRGQSIGRQSPSNMRRGALLGPMLTCYRWRTVPLSLLPACCLALAPSPPCWCSAGRGGWGAASPCARRGR